MCSQHRASRQGTSKARCRRRQRRPALPSLCCCFHPQRNVFLLSFATSLSSDGLDVAFSSCDEESAGAVLARRPVCPCKLCTSGECWEKVAKRASNCAADLRFVPLPPPPQGHRCPPVYHHRALCPFPLPSQAASRCAVLKAASAAFCQLSPFGTSAAAAADDEQHAASTPSSTAAPSAGAGPAAESAPGSGQPSPASITDLPAKLALLEAVGVSPAAALQHYTPYLCSPAHHVATRLAFLEARTKLRRPPRLWQARPAA